MKGLQIIWPGFTGFKRRGQRLGGLILLCLGLLLASSSPLAGNADPAPVQVLLALDTSGSMKQNDPLRLLPKAAAVMVNLLDNRDGLGLLRFDESPSLLLELGTLTASHRRQCLSRLNRLTPRGPYADIPAVLEAAPGAFKDTGTSTRALILVTQGQMDPEPGKGSAESSLKRLRQEIIPSYQKADIAVCPVAFTPNCDQAVLRELAASTRGWFLLVDSAAQLPQAFVRLYEQLKQPQLAPLVDNRFYIDPEVKEAVLLASREKPEKSVRLTDPFGRHLTPKSVSRQVRWLEAPALDMVTLRQPRPGEWKVSGSQAGQGTVGLRTHLALRCPHMPAEIGADEELIVGAVIADRGRPVTQAEFLEQIEMRAILTPENRESRTEKLRAPPAGQRGCWPPGSMTASFPPLGAPGTASLTVRAQGRTFRRERRFALRVAPPWYRENVTGAPDADAGQIEFLPAGRGLPGEVHGWASMQPATGGVAATLFRPGPAGNFALALPGSGLRPAGVELRLTGVTSSGRPLSIRPVPVKIEASALGAAGGFSHPGVIAGLKGKVHKIRVRLRPLALALKTRSGKAAFLVLFAGALAAGLLMTRASRWVFLHRSLGLQSSLQGGGQERLFLQARIDNLQKEKAELAAKLEHAQARLKQLAADNAGLMKQLEQKSQVVREKARIISELQRQLQEAEHESEAVEQEYMALYARSQGDKGVLKKG